MQNKRIHLKGKYRDSNVTVSVTYSYHWSLKGLSDFHVQPFIFLCSSVPFNSTHEHTYSVLSRPNSIIYRVWCNFWEITQGRWRIRRFSPTTVLLLDRRLRLNVKTVYFLANIFQINTIVRKHAHVRNIQFLKYFYIYIL